MEIPAVQSGLCNARQLLGYKLRDQTKTLFDSLISSLLSIAYQHYDDTPKTLRPKFFLSLFQLGGIFMFKGVQGYIFLISRRKCLILGFPFKIFSQLRLASCSVRWVVPRVLISDLRLQDLFLFQFFGAFPAAGLYFFLLMGKYTTYDKDFPVLQPFLSLRLLIKSAREVTYKPSVF